MAALATTLFAAGAQAQAAPDTSKDKRGVEAASAGGSKLAAAAEALVEGKSGLVPVTPKRVLDTRDGTGPGETAPIGQGKTITLDLSTETPVDAGSAVLNLTGTQVTGSTYLTVWPIEAPQPLASNINLNPGTTRSNAVVVALGPSRQVNVYNNSGSSHAILDLSGYYRFDTGSRYTPRTPERVLDTRNGGPVGQGGSVDIDFSGRVPSDATAVTFNLTGINATAGTFVSAYPSGTTRPNVSNLNLAPNEITPNLVTVPLGTNKRVTLFNNAGSVHLAADLAGSFSPSTGSYFYSFPPVREVDTRTGTLGPLDPSWALVLHWYKDEVKGITGNLTGTEPTQPGFVSAWPGGQDQPFTSNLNLVPGQTAANMISVGVGYEPGFDGKSVLFANQNGSVHVIFDVAGVYADFA
ncbi:hypothetical protein GCM10011609_42800 [Lentzea pudingi]|uniref:Uncharacterized protein n=1 Tax=Lentzea pudingi TaxID=1789439 RepID=A0ABQ2I6D4_9PSEU|nr:hypothetical protein [Lentzea pudingi]GGM99910.1 hypothetical protein GCM10011609_42800 [Lentzea pudingi]